MAETLDAMMMGNGRHLNGRGVVTKYEYQTTRKSRGINEIQNTFLIQYVQ
jgi:hypothetical protein